jgi:hypothetical protein
VIERGPTLSKLGCTVCIIPGVVAVAGLKIVDRRRP